MVAFRLNERDVQADVPDGASLLSVLSLDLSAFGPRFGCGMSQCGACTVLVDGDPVRACVTKAAAVAGRSVTTLEGLRNQGRASRLQQAMIDEQAAQCGYCLSGVVMEAAAFLDRNPNPTEAQVRTALDGHLCRCGAQNRIVRAVLRAAKEA